MSAVGWWEPGGERERGLRWCYIVIYGDIVEIVDRIEGEEGGAFDFRSFSLDLVAGFCICVFVGKPEEDKHTRSERVV